MVLPLSIRNLNTPPTPPQLSNEVRIVLLKIIESLQQMKEVVVPRKLPNTQKMRKATIISTYIVCILGILPCCHALWSWKKLREFSIQWKLIPGLFYLGFGPSVCPPLNLHSRKECAFVQE